MIVGGTSRERRRFNYSPITFPVAKNISLPVPNAPWTDNWAEGASSVQPVDTPQGFTWGEKWRYEDPFHAVGAIPFAGIPYRLFVVGASYLLDLATSKQQGITPISFPANQKPGWMQSHLLL